MIHISQLHKMIEQGEFSLKFVSRSGEVIYAGRCICSSFHSEGRTLNIKYCDSGEVRKIRRVSILSVNDQDLVL